MSTGFLLKSYGLNPSIPSICYISPINSLMTMNGKLSTHDARFSRSRQTLSSIFVNWDLCSHTSPLLSSWKQQTRPSLLYVISTFLFNSLLTEVNTEGWGDCQPVWICAKVYLCVLEIWDLRKRAPKYWAFRRFSSSIVCLYSCSVINYIPNQLHYK